MKSFTFQQAKKMFSIATLITGAGAIAACGDADAADGSGGGGGSAFHASVAPLPGFEYDTGLLPKTSPAQVQMKVSAGGALTVDAAFDGAKAGLTGKKGGGKLALDIHVKMDGTLKVDTPVKKYDGDLPGLADVDVPIKSEVVFDPFLLKEGESADAKADVPETELPPIPLGQVPGKLHLTVATGSYLSTSLSGHCVSVKGGSATYVSVAKTSGKLLLKGKIVLELPAPFNKSFDLPAIEVPVPEIPATLTSEAVAVSGVDDGDSGTCGGAPSPGSTPNSKDGTDGDGAEGKDEPGDTDAGTKASTISLTVDGKVATIGDITRNSDNGTETVHAYFTAPGFGPNANFVIQSKKPGSGCIDNDLGGVWLDPDDGWGQLLLATPLDANCGLTITQLKPRVQGTFDGAVDNANQENYHTVKAVFDIAPPK